MSQGPCVVHNGITCDTKHVCATSTGCSDPWENQQFDLQKKAIQKRRWVFQPLIFRDYLGLGRVLFNSSCWFHVSKNQYYAFTSLPTCTSWLLRYLDNKITIKDTKTSTVDFKDNPSAEAEMRTILCVFKSCISFFFLLIGKILKKKGSLEALCNEKNLISHHRTRGKSIYGIYVYTFKTKNNATTSEYQ